MKKILNLIMVIFISCFMFTLSGCTKADFRIGICQLVRHEALDDATVGFIDALEEEMQKVNKTVKIYNKNAQGDSDKCTTICSTFVGRGYDLIMANATPALQAAVNATTSIPILGTSITTYSAALDIELENGKTNMNVSGTSDLADLEAQAQMILDLCSDKKNIGIIYCTAEDNSKYQVEIVKEYLNNKNGIICKEYGFSDSNDCSSVCLKCANECDVVYIPTDNSCASNKEIINSVFSLNDIPVFAGEGAFVSSDVAVASLTISYYKIGYQTGLMAAKILLDGEDVSKMVIQYDNDAKKIFNSDLASKFNIIIPNDYTDVKEK